MQVDEDEKKLRVVSVCVPARVQSTSMKKNNKVQKQTAETARHEEVGGCKKRLGADAIELKNQRQHVMPTQEPVNQTTLHY